MSKLTLALVFFLVALSTHYYSCIGAATSQLTVGFYKGKCGEADVEAIVARVVKTMFMKDPTITAALLRGCDASILLDGEDSERKSPTNVGLRGFDVIDAIKNTLERSCPGVVSWADIISLATRDAVALAETGRQDSNVSLAKLVDSNIPDPSFSVSESINAFQKKGIDSTDMTYLLGAHTVGVANCSFFQYRLYNFNNTGKPDPTMSRQLLATLRRACAENATVDQSVHLDRNRSSILTMDNSYFKQIRLHRGVLQIDQELAFDPATRDIVNRAAERVEDFVSQFTQAIINLGAVEVLTGTQGEIRRTCNVVNAKN